MGWNEPSGDNKDQNPWGKGNKGNGDGPPDLDEIIKKMQEGLGGIFGKKSSGMGGRGSQGPGGGSSLILLGIVVILAGWLVYDITYTIDQQERGVVMRFGHYHKTMQPGLNFALPSFIDRVERINVGQVRSFEHTASMLTQDENIVNVEVAVQWRINEPEDYLFNVVQPDMTLRQVAEGAIRSVIGKSTLDFVLTEGRSDVAQSQQELMQQILTDYDAGIMIVKVDMQNSRPPEPVKAAFDDAIKAREDEQRLVNEAEAYRNEILPQARGQAARIREQSSGYKARVVAESEGDAARFEQLLTEYERAPAVTRERLYL
ncbi:MAG: FtsH protease activity modulator HflK, partial [Gammaproteobacteria bacterium]